MITETYCLVPPTAGFFIGVPGGYTTIELHWRPTLVQQQLH